jgi:hypothetical protein
MKHLLLVIIVMITACKMNTKERVEAQLKQAMLKQLFEDHGSDSSIVKFRIENVVFYNDKVRHFYDCEFKVRMITGSNSDTTGTMAARISEDFKTVGRKY